VVGRQAVGSQEDQIVLAHALGLAEGRGESQGRWRGGRVERQDLA
jgi:hypothetical protein